MAQDHANAQVDALVRGRQPRCCGAQQLVVPHSF